MEQYIPKSTLIAEIEKRIKETESMQPKFDQFWAGQISAFKGILKILETLEVKEVDLEKEIEEYLSTYWPEKKELHPFLGHTAKQFFELGMAVSNKALKEAVEAGIKYTLENLI